MTRPNRYRSGGALIEFAVCLPVFLLITMGTIETCRALYLRQSAEIAAYECARLAILPGATLESMQDQCDVIMLGRNLDTYEFSCQPPDPSQVDYPDTITTTVRIPADESTMINNWFYRDKTFEANVTIMAEF